MINLPIEQAATTGAWAAVTMGTNQACEAFVARARAGNSFKISDVAAGTTYFTVTDSISVENYTQKGSILFYAQMVDTNDTIEVLTT